MASTKLESGAKIPEWIEIDLTNDVTLPAGTVGLHIVTNATGLKITVFTDAAQTTTTEIYMRQASNYTLPASNFYGIDVSATDKASFLPANTLHALVVRGR